MAYGITSESQILDSATVAAGCNAMCKAAEDFLDCGKKVSEAGSICTPQVLSVDNTSMEGVLGALGTSISNVQATISDYANSVASLAASIEAAQRAELAEYLRRLAEAEEAARRNKSNS